MLAIETRDFARGLAFNRSFFQISAFVVCHFALSNAELRF
jgi:hypothetical protein